MIRIASMSVNKQTAIKSNEVVLLPLYRGDHYSQESITCNYSYSTVSTKKLAPKKFRPSENFFMALVWSHNMTQKVNSGWPR